MFCFSWVLSTLILWIWWSWWVTEQLLQLLSLLVFCFLNCYNAKILSPSTYQPTRLLELLEIGLPTLHDAVHQIGILEGDKVTENQSIKMLHCSRASEIIDLLLGCKGFCYWWHIKALIIKNNCSNDTRFDKSPCLDLSYIRWIVVTTNVICLPTISNSNKFLSYLILSYLRSFFLFPII